MKKMTLAVGFIFTLLLVVSCSKETPIKEDLETGILCDLEYEVNYSEWCIHKELKYHIGYPNITCFDSMLISFPLINNLVSQYGNPPFKADHVFFTYFESSDLYRIESYDCFDGVDKIRYYIFIEREDLLDPTEVNALFYFFKENESFPSDSLKVEFRPWS